MNNNTFKKIRTVKRPKVIIFFILTLLISLCTHPALATNYECVTEHVVLWKDGHLIPQNSHSFNGVHDVLHFDDETGDFWIAEDKDAFLNPMPFKVIKGFLPGNQFSLGNTMLAVYDGGDDKWNAGSSLRINASDKKTGLVFLFDSTAEPAIYTGKCHIYDKDIPAVVRDKKTPQ